MSKRYKLTAILSLLVAGTFFINNLTIMASIRPTTTSVQKVILSPKEQTVTKNKEISEISFLDQF